MILKAVQALHAAAAAAAAPVAALRGRIAEPLSQTNWLGLGLSV